MDVKKDVWNLDDLFGNRDEKQIENNIIILKNKIVEKKQLLTNKDVPAHTVLELIKLSEELDIDFSRIGAYYELRSHIDINDEEANAKLDYYRQLSADIDNETMFFDLWFIKLADEQAQKYVSDPILSEYKQYLKDLIKMKPYTKSEEIEQILNLKNMTGRGAFSNIYDVLTASFNYELLDEKDLTQEDITSKYSDPDPKIREEAYKAILKVYKDNSLTLSELYKNIVLDWNNEKIKIRKYKNAIHSRNMSNDLTQEVVQTMITTIREHAYLFQEYFKLKQEFLDKKEQPHPHSRFHIYAPYKLEKEYEYEESKKIVLETFKEFDEEFYTYAKKIIDEKHIHSHPQKGKRSGAFCYAPNTQTTPYVMLNHTNKLRDLFTMMHELGHGIHDIYTYDQPDLIHHPVLPLAETASIFAETILSKKLLQTNKEDEKAAMLIYTLDHYYASILRQTYFIIFEEIAHKKIMAGATKKELDDEYYNLLKEQFSDMEIPDMFKHEWNYIPHIHHTPFYCYAYSWGNLLVLALYAEYEKNPEFKEKIKNILKAGASKDTLEILQDAGIDPTKKEFWEAGFKIIKDELEELRKITK